MVLAIRPKRDPLSIRRPARSVALAEQFRELLGFFCAIEWRDPNMFLRRPDHRFRVGRNLEVLRGLVGPANVTERARLAPGAIEARRLWRWHLAQAGRVR